MNPTLRFHFERQPPSISVLVELLQRKTGLIITCRDESITNPRKSLIQKTGIDFISSEIPIQRYFVGYDFADYEVKVLYGLENNYINIYVFNPKKRYFEGVLILSLLNLGGKVGIESEQMIQSVPSWANFTYEEASKMPSFVA